MDNQKPMKAVIFAGGVGTRMWPMSRKKSPKQFEPIMEGKSTLQLAVERLRPEFDWSDIYISTGQQYIALVKKQLPDIPPDHIIGEPEMRDVAPAVGYLMVRLVKEFAQTPVAILWSDHLVERVDVFKQVLFAGSELLEKDPNRFIFIGQKPRFANQNLGWIEYGQTVDSINGYSVHEFISWHYRPDLQTAKKYFYSHHHAWNPGYFVVTPDFVLQLFKLHVPDMYEKLTEIGTALGTETEQQVVNQVYPQLEKISFDDAVVTKTEPNKAVVISADLGWSDIGAWEALKEALQSHPTDNLVQGNVQIIDSTNSVVYSYTDQLVAAIEVSDMIIVVTPDAILVTPHHAIPKIKTLLKQFEGTSLEKYT